MAEAMALFQDVFAAISICGNICPIVDPDNYCMCRPILDCLFSTSYALYGKFVLRMSVLYGFCTQEKIHLFLLFFNN